MGEKLVNGVMTFVNTKAVRALKDGIIFTLPLTMIGSIFLLLAQLPSPAINNFLISIFGENFRTPLFQVYGATFNIIALVAVVAIAYQYAKLCNHDGLNAGFLALVTFLILSPGSKTDAASGIT
ncbi:MAG: PTS transporter subunit EIIC, partial [Youngiibacter sp.]|nr:PTS transporter subunit EIIC [Youngiibacter sp.]